MLNPEKIWHEYLTDLSTSPIRCSHFTLGNSQSFFNIIIHTLYIIFVINIKNCSLSTMLTATDQKPQKSLKGDITHHHIAWKSTWCWVMPRLFVLFWDHGLRGSASPVLTATGFVNWEMAIFDLPTESTPLNQSPKNLVQVIILAAPTAVPNLVQIRPWEASGQMGEI